jgi:hypothetical protein
MQQSSITLGEPRTPPPLSALSIRVRQAEGQWHAVSMDYAAAGMGDTQDEAKAELARHLRTLISWHESHPDTPVLQPDLRPQSSLSLMLGRLLRGHYLAFHDTLDLRPGSAQHRPA